MSRRKRTPISGLGRSISPRAVELWQQCCEMVRRGLSEDDKSVRDLASELHLELGLKPWHPRATDVGSEPPDWLRDPFHVRDWRTVIEMRRCLEELSGERRESEVDGAGVEMVQ